MGGTHAYFSKGNIKIGLVMEMCYISIMKIVDGKHVKSYMFQLDEDEWYDNHCSNYERKPLTGVEYTMFNMICDRYKNDGYVEEDWDFREQYFNWDDFEKLPVQELQIPIDFFE